MRSLRHLLPSIMKGAVVLTLVLATSMYFAAMWSMDYLNYVRDSYKVMVWNGFEPERGLYNFTVVTAMVDIGRGSWSTPQKRTYNTYLLYMHRVLSLDVNMVVFVDARGRPFVDWMRRGREKRTLVVETRIDNLPYYKHRQRIKEIMESVEYRTDNELVKKGLCESYIPEYDILQWSKIYFVHEAVKRNPFSNSYYIWLDGGYGHGKDIHPSDGVWVPRNLFEYSHQVTFLEREPVDKYKQYADRLHKMSINVIAGLFFAGGNQVFTRLYALQQELIAEWMKNGVVDDDQSAYMLMYYREPQLFHLVPGDWDDVFKLFNSHQS